jgi:hypothetical protein
LPFFFTRLHVSFIIYLHLFVHCIATIRITLAICTTTNSDNDNDDPSNPNDHDHDYRDHNHYHHHLHRTMMKTGPNDASGVIWAISEVFFFLLCFNLLTDVLLCI